MNLTRVEEPGLLFVEGAPDQPLLASSRDTNRLLEVCFAEQVGAALLYAANLPAAFFDISTGEAGEILQKLRNYRVRLAVVCPPGGVAMSRRFGELLADELGGAHFGVFDDRPAACAWLRRHGA